MAWAQEIIIYQGQWPEPTEVFIGDVCFLKFIYLLRERKRKRAGKGLRERKEKESQASSMLSVKNLMWGSNSRTMRS